MVNGEWYSLIEGPKKRKKKEKKYIYIVCTCNVEGPAAGSAVVALDATTSVFRLTDTRFPNDFEGDAVSLIISVHGAWR